MMLCLKIRINKVPPTHSWSSCSHWNTMFRHTHVRHIFAHISHEFPWSIPWYAHVFFLKSPCQDTSRGKKNMSVGQSPFTSPCLMNYPHSNLHKTLGQITGKSPFIDDFHDFPLKSHDAPWHLPVSSFPLEKKRKPSSFMEKPQPTPWLARVAGRNAPKMWSRRCGQKINRVVDAKSENHLAVGQNLVPLVNIKIAGKWMFIPLKMVLIGIDP